MPMPRAPTAVQIPMAFARSLRGNVLVMIESVAGRTRAAPTPCRPAERDQLSCRSSDCGSDRTRPKDDEAYRHPPFSPEAITQASAEEQQTGEDQYIAVDDPLDRRCGSPEVNGYRRKGGIDHAVVDEDNERADRHHRQNQPRLATAWVAGAERVGVVLTFPSFLARMGISTPIEMLL